MNKSVYRILILGLSTVLMSVGTLAQTARQYCEDMYPIESYEAEERQQYIEECIAVTADAYDEPTNDEYYDGTVEDFVESLPEEDAANSPDFESESGSDEYSYE